MKNKALYRVAVLILSLLSCTQPVLAQPLDSLIQKFERRSHSFQSTNIPYRLFVPENYDPAVSYPVILALHGSGERGQDNERHIRFHGMATSWVDTLSQRENPTFVVAPQCPLGNRWVDAPVINGIYDINSAPISNELETVINLMDSLLVRYNIDLNRQYVTGLSMGGYGTWDLLARFPDRFAAAIPMSGGSDPSRIRDFKDLPVWNFHGEIDAVVPANGSRASMLAFEQIHRLVNYTHCEFGNCTGLSTAMIDSLILAEEQLFYTEYPSGGHIIWEMAYEDPLLPKWLFQQYRLQPGAIVFDGLNNYPSLSGTTTIRWSTPFAQPGDSIKIRFSPDGDRSWQLLRDYQLNTNQIVIDTDSLPDVAFGRLEISLKNSNSFIYGKSRSGFFAINNSVNGVPTVDIRNPEFRFPGAILDQEQFDLSLLIGDAEPNPINLMLFYSIDQGSTFQQIDAVVTNTDTLIQVVGIDLTALPNSSEGIFKVLVDDGNQSAQALTPAFTKTTFRPNTKTARQIAGPSSAEIIINIIDPSQLSGDRYQITFDDTSSAQISYDIRNLASGDIILDNITHNFDGLSEGPAFDGIRLAIADVNPININPTLTGWTIGNSSLDIDGSFVPVFQVGLNQLFCERYPADYQITFSDVVVDTSIAIVGLPANPMRFQLHNITENRPVEAIFIDRDNDQQISPTDRVVILERDDNGDYLCTWTLVGAGDLSQPPLPGDEFTMTLTKMLSARDIYEFSGSLTDLPSEGNVVGSDFALAPNYPNPFNPSTTIRFSLGESTEISLVIYNALGQEVRTLVSGRHATGLYQTSWDGHDNSGNMVSSGIYFYRLQAGSFVKTRRMLLIR